MSHPPEEIPPPENPEKKPTEHSQPESDVENQDSFDPKEVLPPPQPNPLDLLKAMQALQNQTPYRPAPTASLIPPVGPQLGLSIQTQVVQTNALSPVLLDTLEKHSPGAVGRLLTMAERQQDAVITANQNAQNYTRGDIRRAHYIAAGLSVLAIAAAIYSEKLGYPWVASAFLTFPVAAVINAIMGSNASKPK